MEINYYFDAADPLRPFTHSLEANPASLSPADATRIAPQMKDGFRPCWDGEKWIQVEDFRGRKGWLGREELTIGNLGPLPDGWSDEPPEPTPEEKSIARIEAIKAELLSLDLASLRPLRAIADGTATDEDRDRLAGVNKKMESLRAELRELEEALSEQDTLD